MTALLDISGRRFGRLVVVRRAPRGSVDRQARWECVCDCGETTVTQGRNLRSGHTRSCGCLVVETTRRIATKHGYGKSRERAIWAGMIQRCHNPGSPSYGRYGGRRITVCAEWRASFMAFFRAMGRRPSARHQIDRIDGSRGYEPGNCRWATPVEQSRNRSCAILITIGDVSEPLTAWIERLGLPADLRTYNRIRWRLNRGWDAHAALTHPICGGRPHAA